MTLIRILIFLLAIPGFWTGTKAQTLPPEEWACLRLTTERDFTLLQDTSFELASTTNPITKEEWITDTPFKFCQESISSIGFDDRALHLVTTYQDTFSIYPFGIITKHTDDLEVETFAVVDKDRIQIQWDLAYWGSADLNGGLFTKVRVTINAKDQQISIAYGRLQNVNRNQQYRFTDQAILMLKHSAEPNPFSVTVLPNSFSIDARSSDKQGTAKDVFKQWPVGSHFTLELDDQSILRSPSEDELFISAPEYDGQEYLFWESNPDFLVRNVRFFDTAGNVIAAINETPLERFFWSVGYLNEGVYMIEFELENYPVTMITLTVLPNGE